MTLQRGCEKWCEDTMRELVSNCTCRTYRNAGYVVLEALGNDKPELVRRAAYLPDYLTDAVADEVQKARLFAAGGVTFAIG